MWKRAAIKKLYAKLFYLVNKNKIHSNLSLGPAEMVHLNNFNPFSEEETTFKNHVKCFSSVLLSFVNVTVECGDVQHRYLSKTDLRSGISAHFCYISSISKWASVWCGNVGAFPGLSVRSCSQINISPLYYLKGATVLQATLFVQSIFLTAAASGIFCLNHWDYVEEAGVISADVFYGQDHNKCDLAVWTFRLRKAILPSSSFQQIWDFLILFSFKSSLTDLG